MTRYVHVSIGPVQSFVAQSTRTRDLWASSYLLSFLAAKAMRRAVDEGGELVSPHMEGNALWGWITEPTNELPRTGSVPNQFTIAVGADRDGATIAAAVERGFFDTWQRVSDAVWRKYLANSTAATREIWERQVAGFWELTWVVDDDELPARGLGARKAWRTHELPDEPGDKCTVIPELQELSGEIRARGAEARARQDAFWADLAERKGVGVLDLDPKARLCAIALIKRLYPRVANSALGQQLDQVAWPSSVDLAAVPWCERVATAAPDTARAYAEAVVAARGSSACTGGVSGQVTAPPGSELETFLQLDANWFHASYVKTAALIPPLEANDRGGLGSLLQALHDRVDASGRPLGAPPIYFALLLADGDHLGKLREQLRSETLSAALGQFSSGVEDVVRAHRGTTVYAGGDDVLALLPIDRALDCAAALERAYRAAFQDAPGATLSAAVVFAHARAPLDGVLSAAHRLLSDVAKQANGRASLVVAVMRRSAPTAQWVTTWQRPGLPAVQAIDAVVAQMAHDGRLLSGALDHAIWDMLRRLGAGVDWQPGSFAQIDASLDLEPLLRAAAQQSLSHRDVDAADEQAARVAALIHPLLAPARNLPPTASAVHEVGLDALLVARFLAGGGLEGEHQ